MIILYLLVGYSALFLVIWLHEVGHAIMYTKYKCKENPFKVSVPVYLFFSTPLPVNEEKVKTLSDKENFYIGITGIIVNLCFGIPSFVVLSLMKNNLSIFIFFLYSFSLFHLVEASTYLVINNIFPASDMILIQRYDHRLRIPLLLVGLIITCSIIYMVIKTRTAGGLDI